MSERFFFCPECDRVKREADVAAALDPDEDDGFAEHDADDAIKDALYEDGAS